MRFLLTLLMACGFAVSAQAQPATPSDDPSEQLDEAARLLFEDGTRAYDAGRFDEARGRYENAYELSGRPELLYNIASCHDRLDEKELALENYERFIAASPDSSRAGVVNSRITVLRRSLSPDEAGGATDPETPSRSLAGPIAAFAVAGAGLITFAVAGLIANSRYNDAEDQCLMGGCDEDAFSAIDRGALIADIGLGLAVAGAAVGVIWLIMGSKESDDDSNASRNPSLAPTFSSRHAGLSLQGAF